MSIDSICISHLLSRAGEKIDDSCCLGPDNGNGADGKLGGCGNRLLLFNFAMRSGIISISLSYIPTNTCFFVRQSRHSRLRFRRRASPSRATTRLPSSRPRTRPRRRSCACRSRSKTAPRAPDLPSGLLRCSRWSPPPSRSRPTTARSATPPRTRPRPRTCAAPLPSTTARRATPPRSDHPCSCPAACLRRPTTAGRRVVQRPVTTLRIPMGSDPAAPGTSKCVDSSRPPLSQMTTPVPPPAIAVQRSAKPVAFHFHHRSSATATTTATAKQGKHALFL